MDTSLILETKVSQGLEQIQIPPFVSWRQILTSTEGYSPGSHCLKEAPGSKEPRPFSVLHSGFINSAACVLR